jgi:cold shock CspA family protein
MGRSQETFNKKEVRTKKEKKRKDKEQKRAKKKNEGKKSSFNDMIAYVDEYGKISSSPPDPGKKIIIAAESIELNITRNNTQAAQDFIRKGIVISFNTSKGYGFIRDLESQKSVFFHVNNLQEPVKEDNVVIFEIGKGPKGPSALKVRLHKESPDQLTE